MIYHKVIDINGIKERIRHGRYKLSFTHTEKLRQRNVEIAELEAELLIITAYEPSPEEWESDWKTRR